MSQIQGRVEAILRALNEQGEQERIEVKRASEVGKSLMETICALSNEPDLDGGVILLGVARSQPDLFGEPHYEIVGVPNPERVMDDVASQCASIFNQPVRPRIKSVVVDGKVVIHLRVFEAASGDKPLFFQTQGLPRGAFRRIGATDQRCSDDDLAMLYEARRQRTYDADAVSGAQWADLDPDAIEEYRRLRRVISPDAEELLLDDRELMIALNAATRTARDPQPTVAGILLFGTSLALRRLFPMTRVDYIRVPGKEWIPNPEQRYLSVEIRAPLIRTIIRAEAALIDDLPKAFHLPEGSLQRRDISPLPTRVLREAVVNAVMHRDYRTHSPIQLIRYANRIEIHNPGYSLKDPDELGSAGSRARNPAIASILHDLNLAETKGTGIQVMQRLMKEAELVPPSFESNRSENLFVARFLLHHFLSEEDLAWISALAEPSLSADEKLVLVYVKEVGAMDNATFRTLTGAETLKASAALRRLCDLDLLEKKGQSTATYYVPTERLRESLSPVHGLKERSTVAGSNRDWDLIKPSMVEGKPSMVEGKPSMVGAERTLSARDALLAQLPALLQESIVRLGGKAEQARVESVILELCHLRAWSAEEIALLTRRNADYLKTTYLKSMVERGDLVYTLPSAPRHPDQAYQATGGPHEM